MRKSKKVAPLLVIVLLSLPAWTAQAESADAGLTATLEKAGKGQYARAITGLLQIIAGNKKPTLYLLLADYYCYNGDLEGARRYFLQEMADDSTNPNLALGLAQVAKHEGNWRDVFAHSKLALELQTSAPQVVELLVESALQLEETDALARALAALRQSDSQQPLYELGYALWRLRIRNLRSAQSTIGAYLKKNETDAFAHRLAAMIAREREAIQEANTHLHKALAFQEPSDPLARIAIFKNLGVHHFRAEQADSARYYFSLAQKGASKIGALREQLQVCRAAMPFHRELGLYQRLASASERAIRIVRKLNLNTEVSTLFYECGWAYEKMHDYRRALQYYGELLQMLQKTDSDDELAARTTLNIGRIWLDLDDQKTALHHLETSINMAEQNGWRALEHEARLHTADIYKNRGEFEEARKRYQRVLRHGQWTQQHDITERCFLKLAHLYLEPDNRNLNNAYYFLGLADALAKQTVQLQFAAKHRWMEGRMSLLEDNIERAEMLFLDAIQMGRETGSAISLLAGHAGLIRTYLRGNFPKLASDHADSVFYYLDDFTERSPFFDLKKEVFEPAITAYSNVGDLEKIYDTCERYKAFMHTAEIEQVKHQIHSAVFDSLNWEIDLANRRIQRRWQDLWATWSDPSDHIDLTSEIKQDIREGQIEKTRQLSFIARQHPDYYDLIKPAPQPLLRLQAQLEKLNAVFLHYMVSANATFITMITPDSLACKRVNITASFLNDRVTGLNPMFNDNSPASSQADAFRMDYAGELYKLLFEPVRPWIPDGLGVIISPDGCLNKLPFECLVTNPRELTDEYDYLHARFLIEDYAVSYIPFARLLESRLDARRPHKSASTLLAFANSDAPPSMPTNGVIASNGTSASRQARVREVEQIAQVVGEDDTVLYLEQQATKHHFLEQSDRFKLIHLALPTVLNGNHPLYSEIHFADGTYLNAANLFNLNLKAWTMTLSAARQNRGGAATEGIGGLFHGLQVAGIRTLVSTRWDPVHQDNLEIIVRFYANLMDGVEQAEALQQAKVHFLQTYDRNPYHWAPLMLVGYPGKVKIQTAAIEVIVFVTAIGVVLLLGVIMWRILKLKREAPSLQG